MNKTNSKERKCEDCKGRPFGAVHTTRGKFMFGDRLGIRSGVCNDQVFWKWIVFCGFTVSILRVSLICFLWASEIVTANRGFIFTVYVLCSHKDFLTVFSKRGSSSIRWKYVFSPNVSTKRGIRILMPYQNTTIKPK